LDEADMRVLVIGDVIHDQYITGEATRISPESPVPVVLVSDKKSLLGGAGNVALNLKSMGAQVTLLTVLSYDFDIDLLAGLTVISEKEDRKIPVKTRVIAGTQQVVRFDNEDTYPISTLTASSLLDKFKSVCHEFDAIVISDYNKGLITKQFAQDIIWIAYKQGKKVFVDPKNNVDFYQGCFAITPNKKEFGKYFGDVSNQEMPHLLRQNSIDNIIVTLSEDGALLINKEGYELIPVEKQSGDVTGAGDTFLAALVVGYLEGKSMVGSVAFANKAASMSVKLMGTVAIYREDVERGDSKLYTLDSLLKVIKNKKAVFTNGCFDVLHVGHIHLLKEARKKGDFLVVAINSDASVKRLKGESRPIFNQSHRAQMVASLSCVDAIIIFGEDTPYEILSHIKPQVLVKGSDYQASAVVGGEFASEVVIVPLFNSEENSTTKIIERWISR
jgi:D-beta-D-heptose 7-phosphate kinase / D-beta-D-heptose 1-phosphate adenosyltransferase